MNQPSRTIYSSSSAYLFNELNSLLEFSSFGSWTKFNELIIESSSELLSSWFGSLPALTVTVKFIHRDYTYMIGCMLLNTFHFHSPS